MTEQKIRERIKRLMAMTAARGCTEAEALEARYPDSRAGNNVPLAHGIGGEADRLMIGGRR